MYVYYFTRDFIGSTRAFNPLLVLLPTRAFNLATRAFNLLTRELELVNHGFQLVTCRFELVTRIFELVTRSSCFTFPRTTRSEKTSGN